MKRILHSDWLPKRARPLRISRVGSARKSSLFGHTINPLLPSLFIQLNKNANENFANIDTEKCQFSSAGQSLIQPFREPFEHNLSQNSSIKRLFQPTVGPISALANWTYWPCFKGAKLDSKKGLYFTHRNGPIFRAKTDLSDLEWSHHDFTRIIIRFWETARLPLS